MAERASILGGLILTVIGAVVWSVRQEGRINALEMQVLQSQKQLEVIEETGSKLFRTRIAVVDQKFKEIAKGFTPYGVANLQNHLWNMEAERRLIETDVEQRLRKLEEKTAGSQRGQVQ